MLLVGKASDLAQPGGFRRDHVIATAQDEELQPPSHAFRPFMEVVHPPSRFRSAQEYLEQTYDDFVYAKFEVGLSAEDFEDSQRTPLIRRVPHKR